MQVKTELFSELFTNKNFEYSFVLFISNQTLNLCKPNHILQCFLIFSGSLICADNVGTHKKTVESKNGVNRGYLVCSTKGDENRIEL